MSELFPKTTSAWLRLKLAWHSYRYETHNLKAMRHALRARQLKGENR